MQNCVKLLPLALKCQQRAISTTAPVAGKRNFRKFNVYSKRGTRVVKEAQRTLAAPPVAIHKREVRDTGMTVSGQYMEIAEIPDSRYLRL